MSFLSTANPTSVMKFYSNVMDDVLAGVREAFLDEGVDEQVLQELKQMWEAKIQASKAIDPPEIVEPQPPPLQIAQPPSNDHKNVNQAKQTNGVPVSSTQSSRAKPVAVASVLPSPSTVATPVTTSSSNIPSIQQSQTQLSQPSQIPQVLSQPAPNNLQDKLVPIQLTLPAPAGAQDNQSRIYNIQVPASALATDQLQRILTAQVISATMALPTNVASTLLQQHVTAALQSQANHTQSNTSSNNTSNTQMNGVQGVLLTDNSNNRQFPHMTGNITQVDGTYHSSDDESNNTCCYGSSVSVPRKKISIQIKSKVLQLDGIYDTSSDDEDDDDDDDLDDDEDDEDEDENDEKEEDNDEAENGVEEDPLNSGDDVSEGDNTDLFETENVVVCQYDKINRSRNKWKFYLKDGIMNLAGRDYIFQKANGDAEW